MSSLLTLAEREESWMNRGMGGLLGTSACQRYPHTSTYERVRERLKQVTRPSEHEHDQALEPRGPAQRWTPTTLPPKPQVTPPRSRIATGSGILLSGPRMLVRKAGRASRWWAWSGGRRVRCRSLWIHHHSHPVDVQEAVQTLWLALSSWNPRTQNNLLGFGGVLVVVGEEGR